MLNIMSLQIKKYQPPTPVTESRWISQIPICGINSTNSNMGIGYFILGAFSSNVILVNQMSLLFYPKKRKIRYERKTFVLGSPAWRFELKTSKTVKHLRTTR